MRGHIIRKDEAGELADLKLLSRIRKTIQGRSGVGLVIMPTYDCNFRCPYCFEQHRMISIGPDLKDVHSPKETLYLNSIPKTWNLLQELLLQFD